MGGMAGRVPEVCLWLSRLPGRAPAVQQGALFGWLLNLLYTRADLFSPFFFYFLFNQCHCFRVTMTTPMLCDFPEGLADPEAAVLWALVCDRDQWWKCYTKQSARVQEQASEKVPLPEGDTQTVLSSSRSVSACGHLLETQSPGFMMWACLVASLSPLKSQPPRREAGIHHKSHFHVNSLSMLVQQNAVLEPTE